MSGTTSSFEVAGLGEVLWDMLPTGRKLGGAPANFAYHARALGLKSSVVSCVGDDELGREIAKRLTGFGLGTECLAVSSQAPTGTVDVEIDPRGQPTFVIHENVAWDAIPWGVELSRLAGRIDAVCFGSLCQRSEGSRTTVRRFLAGTRTECLRVFDINLRQSYYSADVIRRSLEAANVLKLNDDELPVVARLLDLRGDEDARLVSLARTFGLRAAALTKGAHGSVLRTVTERSEHPGIAVDVVDTVGAGDAFTASMVLGLLQGRGLGATNAMANRLGAAVCSREGATPSLPAAVLADEDEQKSSGDGKGGES